jgi:hypothetical protein
VANAINGGEKKNETVTLSLRNNIAVAYDVRNYKPRSFSANAIFPNRVRVSAA